MAVAGALLLNNVGNDQNTASLLNGSDNTTLGGNGGVGSVGSGGNGGNGGAG